MKKRSKSDMPRSRRAMFCCVVPLLLASLGCTSEVLDGPEAEEDGAESVATTQDAAAFCTPTTYAVPGSYNITEDNLCFATRIPNVGTSPNNNYDINLIISHSGGYWYATGQGEMSCVPQSCFFSDGGLEEARMLSGMFQVKAVAKAGQASVFKYTEMWLADAMAFMSTLHYSTASALYAGSLDGENFNPSLTHVLSASASGTGIEGPADSIVITMGYSYFVGKPHSGHRVPGATYSSSRGEKVRMIPVSSGICAVSDFYKMIPGQQIRIYKQDSFWYLQSTSMGPGVATCYLFDQRQNQ